MKREKQGYSKREIRKREIIQALSIGYEYTTWEIAKLIDMRPSSHLRNLLCEMLAEHRIRGYARPRKSKVTFVWFVAQPDKLL